MSNGNWSNNEIQFARLLCEMIAHRDGTNIHEIAKSMDLEPHDIVELLERATYVWEDAKERAVAPTLPIDFGERIEGAVPPQWLVTLKCGHTKRVLKKSFEFPCMECYADNISKSKVPGSGSGID